MITTKLFLSSILIFASISKIGQSSTVKESRRFLITYGCQKCYECYCRLSECPTFNPLAWVGAWSGCIDLLKDLDCSVPYLRQGQWSSWGEWSSCSGNCKFASRHRTRNCTNPEPKNCGKTCVGEDKQYEHTCKPSLCDYLDHVGQVWLSRLNVTTTTTTTSQPMTSTPYTTSQSIVTTIPSTSVVTTANMSSTTPLQVRIVCAKLCAISAVANKISQHKDGANTCADGSTTSSEALLMSCCGLPKPDQWHPGPKVMMYCGTIPQYLPVASFEDGQIQPGSEGIFIDCLQSPEVGFQIIRQDCSTAPSIIHINSTQTAFPNPYSYHIVS